jgi:hypothetical protein
LGNLGEIRAVREVFEVILEGQEKGSERAFTSGFKGMTTFLYYLLGF